MKIQNLQEGTSLPGLSKTVNQDNINLYAKASRDFNPIHIDPEFAARSAAGGTIAHGMLILAYLSQMMTMAFEENWLSGGKLNVRFKSPARPGDTIMVSGKINKIFAGQDETIVKCDVICANQKGETVISGEASVRIKNA
jgi:3-hydroxybutyryl-CoA dehydratase